MVYMLAVMTVVDLAAMLGYMTAVMMAVKMVVS